MALEITKENLIIKGGIPYPANTKPYIACWFEVTPANPNHVLIKPKVSFNKDASDAANNFMTPKYIEIANLEIPTRIFFPVESIPDDNVGSNIHNKVLHAVNDYVKTQIEALNPAKTDQPVTSVTGLGGGTLQIESAGHGLKVDDAVNLIDSLANKTAYNVKSIVDDDNFTIEAGGIDDSYTWETTPMTVNMVDILAL